MSTAIWAVFSLTSNCNERGSAVGNHFTNAITLSCVDGRQADDYQSYLKGLGVDPQAYPFTIVGGAAWLVMGRKGEKKSLLRQMALVAKPGITDLHLCAHLGTCAGVHSEGYTFTDPDKEKMQTLEWLFQAAHVFRSDPRFKHIKSIRLHIGIPVTPGSNEFEFEEVFSVQGEVQRTNPQVPMFDGASA